MNNTGIQKGSPQAPRIYAGFSLQGTRFLHLLLEGKFGDAISLEVFEDVGVSSNDGTQTAVQTKNTLSGNPISNKSKEFWKTFCNWIDGIESGFLDVSGTYFEIYVSRSVSGAIADSFSAAKTEPEIKAAIASAREVLWGKSPDYLEREKLSDSIKYYVNQFFTTDEDLLVSLLGRFSYNCGSGHPISDLERQFKSQFISDSKIGDVVIHALGWVKKETELLLEEGKPVSLLYDQFHKEMTTYVRMIDRQQILKSYAPSPTSEEIQSDLQTRQYVRQLELIESDYDDKLTAVTDFLLASVDRTIWSDEGFVNELSFDVYEEDLKRAWKNNKRASDLEYSDKDDVTKGKGLFTKCSLHTSRLEGMDIPGHFTSGSFHALSDQKTIGWHPDYKKKLEYSDEQEGT